MKRYKKRNYVSNFLKAAFVTVIVLIFVISGSALHLNYDKTTEISAIENNILTAIKYDNIFDYTKTIFTIENPPVDFEVVDAEPFDGYGDNGPYSTFNDALLGTIGECRSMAEFDISSFSIPPGEYISNATFEVIITEIDIFGLGVDGETPESLAVDGYVGNGIDELSDFEAGDGNTLDSIDTPDPQIGQILSFDITSFVIDMVNSQQQYIGLTIRAETFGGLWVTEGGVFPKLTIETLTSPDPDLNCDGDINWTDVQPGSTVEGSIEVSNIGVNDSELNWQVIEWPDWSEWTFNPQSGTGLKPEDGPTIIELEVIAPDDPNTEFKGNIKIINSDDPNDYCTITVYLKTPIYKPSIKQQFLKIISEKLFLNKILLIHGYY